MTDLRNDETGERQDFDTGAVRDKLEGVRYDLISPIALRLLAETYSEGAEKYSDHNWRKGMPYSNIMNHLKRHLQLFEMGDRSESHIGHALWGLCALAEFEVTHPECNDLYDFVEAISKVGNEK